ncbi:tail fiber protein [Escherichia phage CY1_Cui-2023]|nr:tail fiber protein [Escherichia phage CY1_Cui-2023]
MAIYDSGTASLAANGTVTGTGTNWMAPLTLIRVGATIVFKTEPVKIYTISEIISDTQINVYNPNSETVPAGTGYAILAHDGITVQGLAQDVAETLRFYQSRESEVATAVDVFKDFNQDKFASDVNQVNTQYGEIVNIGAQVSNDANQVASDKDAAAASAQEAAGYADSINPGLLLAKSQNLADLENKKTARNNLMVPYLSSSPIPSDVNIDSISGVENTGIYYQNNTANATVANGYPEETAGTLFVYSAIANGVRHTTQDYIPSNKQGITYRRQYNLDSGTWKWSAWQRFLSVESFKTIQPEFGSVISATRNVKSFSLEVHEPNRNATIMAWGNNNGRPSVVECKLDNGFLWYAQQNADGGRYFEVNGPINATAFNQTSDREKKDNIEVISDATVKLRMMNGYTYTLKSNGMPYAGVIAQEVQDAIPEAFSGTFEYIDAHGVNPDGTPLQLENRSYMVDYSGITGLLVQVGRETDDRVTKLEREVEELKAIVSTLISK